MNNQIYSSETPPWFCQDEEYLYYDWSKNTPASIAPKNRDMLIFYQTKPKDHEAPAPPQPPWFCITDHLGWPLYEVTEGPHQEVLTGISPQAMDYLKRTGTEESSPGVFIHFTERDEF